MAVAVRVASPAGDLLFEADTTEEDLSEIGFGDRGKDIIKDAGATYASIAATIQQCTQQLLSGIDELLTHQRHGGALASAALELGVKITAQGNVIVAKGTAEGNLKVSLTWDFR